MMLYTAPRDAGQIVTDSYGWHDGCFYCRTYDASDRTSTWRIAADDDALRAYQESDSAPWNVPPPASLTWRRCTNPEAGDVELLP